MVATSWSTTAPAMADMKLDDNSGLFSFLARSGSSVAVAMARRVGGGRPPPFLLLRSALFSLCLSMCGFVCVTDVKELGG